MSKIKNTRELVLRAQAHAREDHIVQGTYGDASTNGHVEFQGCFIGCLSTPHRKRDLRAWIKSKYSKGSADSWGGDEDEFKMVARLQHEFGITKALARECETVFEGLPTHGAAIEFLPAFAKALREGQRITNQDVKQFRRRVHVIALESEERRDALLDWLRGRNA